MRLTAGAGIRLQLSERATLGDMANKFVQQLKLQYESEQPSLLDMWEEHVRLALFSSTTVFSRQGNVRVADCVGARAMV